MAKLPSRRMECSLPQGPAPTGRDAIAQWQRPGFYEQKQTQPCKGEIRINPRPIIHPIRCRPFRALKRFGDDFPGRCPGLSHPAPLGHSRKCPNSIVGALPPQGARRGRQGGLRGKQDADSPGMHGYAPGVDSIISAFQKNICLMFLFCSCVFR